MHAHNGCLKPQNPGITCQWACIPLAAIMEDSPHLLQPLKGMSLLHAHMPLPPCLLPTETHRGFHLLGKPSSTWIRLMILTTSAETPLPGQVTCLVLVHSLIRLVKNTIQPTPAVWAWRVRLLFLAWRPTVSKESLPHSTFSRISHILLIHSIPQWLPGL